MATIIKMTPSAHRGRVSGGSTAANKPRSPEEVRRFMLGIEEDPDEEGFDLLFIPLDERRTAVVGEVEKTQTFLDRLQGTYQRCDNIRDPKGRKRGPGIILTAIQAQQYIDLMVEDGYELNDEIFHVTRERCNFMLEQMRAVR